MSNNRVRQLTPYRELRGFFEYMYGEKAGFVYAPTKDPSTGEWTQNFFRWPEQKREIVEHFKSPTTLELYYSPALWSTNRISRDSFMGVSVLWAEMDYGIPNADTLESRGVPHPTLRIRSSTDDHQHWYWKLEYFENNPDDLEKVTKRLAYAVDADLSCWDYQQVLRPPATIHRESGKPVTVLEQSEASYGIDAFSGLPEPPQEALDGIEDLGELPDVQSLIAKYKWSETAFDTFRQPQAAVHKRSDTLCYLAYECAEMGMANIEIMAILMNADDRWGKFKKRNDRVKHLQGIIQRARFKYPVASPEEVEDDFPIYGFQTFLDLPEARVEWLVNGLIATETINMTAGLPKVGKTQFTVRFGMSLALGQDFLDWEITEAKKSIFFSMDMGKKELHHFFSTMSGDITPDEARILERNFQVIPLGEAVILTQPRNQAKIERLVEKVEPDVVFIDTFGVAVGDDLNSDKVVNPFINWIKSKLINQFGTTVWFIHHNRKPQIGNKKPKTLSDLYGSQFIGGHITTGIGLWQDQAGQETIEVNSLASRLSEEFKSFDVRRTEHLNFTTVQDVMPDQTPPNGQAQRGRAQRGTYPGRSNFSI